MGTVYLIHFEHPLGDSSNPHGQARHYLGFTKDLEARLARHRKCNGSAILAAVTQAGIGWECVRTWHGGRELERRLKQRKDSPKLCPICNPAGWSRRAGGNGSMGHVA